MSFQGRDRVPKHVRAKLQFLWQASQDATTATPPQPRVAQKLLASLRHLAAQHDIEMTSDVTRSMCPSCSAPRIHGVSCRSRTQKRTRRSPDATRWAAERRGVGHAVRAQIITTCLFCGDVRRAPAAAREKAPPQPKRAQPVSGDFVALSPSAPVLPAMQPKRQVAPPPPPGPRLILDNKPRKRKKQPATEPPPAKRR